MLKLPERNNEKITFSSIKADSEQNSAVTNQACCFKEKWRSSCAARQRVRGPLSNELASGDGDGKHAVCPDWWLADCVAVVIRSRWRL